MFACRAYRSRSVALGALQQSHILHHLDQLRHVSGQLPDTVYVRQRVHATPEPLKDDLARLVIRSDRDD